jgi:hypothetical protein
MASVEIVVLRTVATWLGEGRLVAGPDTLDGAAYLDHVAALCALRGVRRWEMVVSMRMMVSIHAGRASWHVSANRMVRETVAALQRQAVFDTAHLQILRINEAGLVARIRELEEEVLDLQGGQDELQMELNELQRAARAERSEPDPEEEP